MKREMLDLVCKETERETEREGKEKAMERFGEGYRGKMVILMLGLIEWMDFDGLMVDGGRRVVLVV